MPLYEFLCPDCHKEQEHLVRGSETPACESCGGQRLTKLLSVPAMHAAGDGPRPQSGPGPCGSSCGCHPH
ncbi:MAG: zinc ribbon domain-containing protein [Pirellulales bacterium]|nr:zinc ribbon domain-containing protein [Pirellulales bacterium]